MAMCAKLKKSTILIPILFFTFLLLCGDAVSIDRKVQDEDWYKLYHFNESVKRKLECSPSQNPLFYPRNEKAGIGELTLDIIAGEVGSSVPIQGILKGVINGKTYKQKVALNPVGVSRKKHCKVPPYRLIPMVTDGEGEPFFKDTTVFVTPQCEAISGDNWIFSDSSFSPLDHLLIEHFIYYILEGVDGLSLKTKLYNLQVDTHDLNVPENILRSSVVLFNEDASDVSSRCKTNFLGNEFTWDEDPFPQKMNYFSSLLVSFANMFVGNLDYYYEINSKKNGLKGHNIFFHHDEDSIYLISYDFDLNVWSVPNYKKNVVKDPKEAATLFSSFLNERVCSCKGLKNLKMFKDGVVKRLGYLESLNVSVEKKQFIRIWTDSMVSTIDSHLSKNKRKLTDKCN